MKPLRLSLNDIKNAYRGVKAHALRAYREGNYERSMHYVRHCATIAQQFNWIYADEELENLLTAISSQIITPPTSYIPNENRVVLFDDFCVSFILALQYLEALVVAGKEVMYLTISQHDERFSDITSTIKEKYPMVKIVSVTQQSIIKTGVEIYNEILAFAPYKVLFHMTANSLACPAIYALPHSIDSYIINLADQTFWLGSKAVKYVLEFRLFGVSVCT